MDARKTGRIIAKGSETEWLEVLEDLEMIDEEWGAEMNDGTRYLMIAIKNALK